MTDTAAATVTPCVTVVLLNWKGWRDTIECLDSLSLLTYATWNVVVVDNHSPDDSLIRIDEWAREAVSRGAYLSYERLPVASDQYRAVASAQTTSTPPARSVVLLENGSNAGFSAGNNVGIRWAIGSGADYVLLLNNDTTVEKGFLGHLVSCTERSPQVAVATPTMYYHSRPDIVWYAGADLPLFAATARVRHFNRRLSNPERLPIRSTGFVTGACMLVRTATLSQLGLLDEDFFFGGEDYEFSRRVATSGALLMHVPAAIVWHKVGSTRPLTERSLYSGYRAQVLSHRKTMSTAAFVAWLTAYAMYVAVRGFVRAGANSSLPRARIWRAAMRGILHGCRGAPITASDLHGSS